jgi:hypothetical protein
MKKKNISIPLLDKFKNPELRRLIKSITLFFFLIIILGVNLSCEKQKDVGPKSNSPPMITSVIILPENPTRESELNLVIQSNDPDGDPIAYRYQWIMNDDDLAGENKSTLGGGILKKGNVIQMRVIPSDGKEDGKPFLSAPVKILNSPPVIQEAWIEPKAPTAVDKLKAYEKSVDADGDSIYFTYRWEMNGIILTDENKEELERGRFKKGDSITVTIIPDDREILGAPKKSAPVVILNSPPIIVSSPPFSVEGTRYLYQVKANDPDNDPVSFTLKSGPKGMTMDQNTGVVQWDLHKEDNGTHTVEIEVSDNEGGKSSQRYTLVIEFK